MDKPWWSTFWGKFLSPATARFVLALASLMLVAWVMHTLGYVDIPELNRDAFMVGLGYVMGLATTAFGFYFGQSQKNEPAATGKPNDPVHVERDL